VTDAFRRFAAALAVAASVWVLFVASAQGQDDQPAWPDTFVARLEALALMQTLNAELLASRSATVSLEDWCRDHRLAAVPEIHADLMPATSHAPTAEQRQRLAVTQAETVRYRRVHLRCGARVLSDAENWYVPGRLTPDMNRLLESTDTPFGRAVAALDPYRRTFAVTMLWAPLGRGWEDGSTRIPSAAAGALSMPDALFEHRAVLYSRDHVPFAEVREVYQRHLLAFAPRLPN